MVEEQEVCNTLTQVLGAMKTDVEFKNFKIETLFI